MVVFLERLADGSGVLAPQERALRLPAGWTVVDHPTDSLAGGASGPGQVTGYLELVPPVTTTVALGGGFQSLISGTGAVTGSLLAWSGTFLAVNPSNTVGLQLNGMHSGTFISLDVTATGIQLAGNLGFYGASPVPQPVRVGQLGAQDVGATPTQASINTVVAALVAKLNAIDLALSQAGGGVGVTA